MSRAPARRARPMVFIGLCLTSMLAPGPLVAHSATKPDPDSPAGVEYQLPLDRARDEAGGSNRQRGNDRQGRDQDGGAAARLFGAGIGPKDGGGGSGGSSASDGSGSSASDGSSSTANGGGRGGGADRESGTAGAPNGTGPEIASAGGDDGSPGLTIAGIALAVLLLGAAAGLGLRRLLRSGPPT